MTGPGITDRVAGDDTGTMPRWDVTDVHESFVVDIHSRFLFEAEVFARRQRRTLGAGELCELMGRAQADAYGDGLGLHAHYRADPDAFRAVYDELLSRAAMDTAEELGAAFGVDVTDEAFWTASLDVLRERIGQYEALAAAEGAA